MNLKKLLSAIGLIAIGAPASLSVVACGTPEQVTKSDLKDIITDKEIDGNIANTKESIITEIINKVSNQKSKLTKNDIEITEFTEAQINIDGMAKINAKEDSNFTGEVDIIVTKLIDPESEEILNVLQKIADTSFTFNSEQTNNEKINTVTVTITNAMKDIKGFDAKNIKFEAITENTIPFKYFSHKYIVNYIIDNGEKDYGLDETTIEVLSEIINKGTDKDVTNRVAGDQTYQEIITNPNNLISQKLIMPLVNRLIKEHGYPKGQIEEIKSYLTVYLVDAIDFAYINTPVDNNEATREDQEIVTTITPEMARERTLNQIYLDEVNKQSEENDWGIEFDINDMPNITKINGFKYARFGAVIKKDLGNVHLKLTDRNFWTAGLARQQLDN